MCSSDLPMPIDAPPAADRTRLWTGVSLALAVLIGLRLAWHLASGAGMYWDFVNFYNAGRRMAELRFVDLYAAAEPLFDEPRLPDGVLTYVGFPLSALVFAPLGFFGPRAALVLFKGACITAGTAGTLLLVQYAWRDQPGKRPQGAWLAVLLDRKSTRLNSSH